MFGEGTGNWFAKNERKPTGKKKKRKKWVAKILQHHRKVILKELDINKVLPYLVYHKVFSLGEYKEILGYKTTAKQAEVFLDQLSVKGPGAFCAFCKVLEEVCPHLLTCFLLDCEDRSESKGPESQNRTKERPMAPHNQVHFGSQDREVAVPPLPPYTAPAFSLW
ncbi:hypothetical protein GN956_G22644 [Arapaima gigas]